MNRKMWQKEDENKRFLDCLIIVIGNGITLTLNTSLSTLLWGTINTTFQIGAKKPML